MLNFAQIRLGFILSCCLVSTAIAGPTMAPGDVSLQSMDGPTRSAYDRVKERLRFEMDTDSFKANLGVAGAYNLRIIRSFENTTDLLQ